MGLQELLLLDEAVKKETLATFSEGDDETLRDRAVAGADGSGFTARKR